MSAVRGYTVSGLAFVTLMSVGVIRWRSVVTRVQPSATSLGSTTLSFVDSLETILAAAEDLTIANDPFRLANAPASVRFTPTNDNGVVGGIAAVAAPLRPNMTLKAIVGGPPWQAIVDGIPGQSPGTVVRAGAAFDKFVTRAVTRDSVVIQGPDTTWVLSFRRRQ